MGKVYPPALELWHGPLKGTTILKAGFFVLAVSLAAFCTLALLLFFSMQPPKERKVIEKFQVNRAAYEQLRNMLLEDRPLDEVYIGYGVETKRYDEYVVLLRQVGSNGVFRSKGEGPELVCVGAWGAGWAGDTRHMWICATDRVPANRVASLDSYYRNPTRPRNVFRHIDGDWYLRADW
jgi:hypothetical protein